MTRIDLHMHSTASDGLLSPTAVVQLAKERGLTTIALTDHDTTAGWEEAMSVGRELGVEVLGGFKWNNYGIIKNRARIIQNSYNGKILIVNFKFVAYLEFVLPFYIVSHNHRVGIAWSEETTCF